MNNEIKKAYEEARIAYEKACKVREEVVMAARAECHAKIVTADAVVAEAYEVHNIAKRAYAREVSKK